MRLRQAVLGAMLMTVGLPVVAAGQSVHFRPGDHALEDVHPFFENGVCSLFYLKPGGYQSALAQSADLVTWKEVPITHTEVAEGDWMAPYYVLGVLRDGEGFYRSFYGHKEGRMVSSVSRDLMKWECAPKAFHIPPGAGYVRRRDPFVFWIPESREYGCVMTTQMAGVAKEKAGAVSYATSKDLRHWVDHGQVLYPGTMGEPECPQVFRLGSFWYLLTSLYDRAVGQPVYWRSTQPGGPWNAEAEGVLDGKDLCAAQIGMEGKTAVLLGWIPDKAARPGKQSWGGCLALPRMVKALANGRLITQIHPGVGKAIRGAGLDAAAAHGRMDIELELKVENHAVELRFADAQGTLKACVCVDPAAGKLMIQDHERVTWSELPIRVEAGKAMPMRVVVEGDLIEVFLDERYSLAGRLPQEVGEVRVTCWPDSALVGGVKVWGLREVAVKP